MMEKTLRAVRISEPGAVAVEEIDVPDPGARQVRIVLEGTGECASNLGRGQGLPWIEYPMPPAEGGHEAWGRVDAVGEGVDGDWMGRRVAAPSTKRSRSGAGVDFVAERYRGTDTEALVEPPDAWGGRTIARWIEQLAADRSFDPEAERLLAVAGVIDAIYRQ